MHRDCALFLNAYFHPEASKQIDWRYTRRLHRPPHCVSFLHLVVRAIFVFPKPLGLFFLFPLYTTDLIVIPFIIACIYEAHTSHLFRNMRLSIDHGANDPIRGCISKEEG